MAKKSTPTACTHISPQDLRLGAGRPFISFDALLEWLEQCEQTFDSRTPWDRASKECIEDLRGSLTAAKADYLANLVKMQAARPTISSADNLDRALESHQEVDRSSHGF